MESNGAIAAVQIAGMVATFYKTLRNEGFNQMQAFDLTSSFLSESLRTSTASAVDKNV